MDHSQEDKDVWTQHNVTKFHLRLSSAVSVQMSASPGQRIVFEGCVLCRKNAAAKSWSKEGVKTSAKI